MDQNNDQKQKGSVDYANDFFRKAQNTFAVIRTGASLSATPFGIAFLVSLGILFAGFMLVVALSGQGIASSEPAPLPTTAPSQISSGQFNITGATDAQKQDIESALSDAMRFSTYAKLLTARGTVNIDVSSGCGGYVSSFDTINLYLSSCPANAKFYLIHETGHIIDGRNRIGQRFNHNDLVNADGSECYDSDGYLKTYPRNSKEGSARDESFAEAIALFLYPKAPLQNFSTQCPATYNWIRDNVYQERM